MKKNYQTKTAPVDLTVPDAVTVAMAELADSMREGLLALAVGAGLQVMQVMMSENVVGLCGPKGAHDPDRSAVRHGSEEGSVTLGGRRVPVRRPRVRTADGASEVAVPAYDLFASTELLGEMALIRRGCRSTGHSARWPGRRATGAPPALVCARTARRR